MSDLHDPRLNTDEGSLPPDTRRTGPLAWMAQNPVAANLLMLLFILGGLMMSSRIKQEVFPEVTLDVINISAIYPGASPEEVEQAVVLSIEEAVRGIDGVKEVQSTSREGMAQVSVELLLGARTDRALRDIQSAVDRITSFPIEVERPIISESSNRNEVVSLILYGAADEKVLRAMAEEIRDDLLGNPGITLVELGGVRPPEVSIEVPEAQLRRYGLTLDQVSRAVRSASVDMPGGSVKTPGGEVLLRMTERRNEGEEFEDIVVLSRPDGTDVTIADLGQVVDGFSETDEEAWFNGQRAVQIKVYRIGSQTPLAISEVVRNYVENHAAQLPPGVDLAVWDDSSEIYRDRMQLLLKNAFLGLLLVLLILGLFLNLRLSFWVTMGIAISFLGAMLFFPAMAVSINMVSLFAFILALGIVVDDAIVIGEAVYTRRMQGLGALDAAIAGVRDVAQPVVFAVLTTIVAFSPLLMVPGVMGKFFKVIPLIVIPILLLSLIEGLFILPAHLAHGRTGPPRGLFAGISRFQARFARWLERFIDLLYVPVVRKAIAYRYLTVALGLAMLIMTASFIVGGKIRFTFMPRIESDVVSANFALPFGASPEDTREIMERLVTEAQAVFEANGGESELSRGIYASLGSSVSRGRGPNAGTSSSGGHLGTVSVFLVPMDDRTISTAQFVRQWRTRVGELPGVDRLSFNFTTGPQAGAPITYELNHVQPQALESAARELADHLTTYAGVMDVDHGVNTGKEQIDLRLKPEARSVGVTQIDLARQVRDAFYGSEALRQQRGRDELRVFVRYPLEERRSEYNIEELMVRTPAGGEVPLGQAAHVDRGRSYTEIIRRDGRRIISVTADVDTDATSAGEVIAAVNQGFMPGLRADHSGLRFEVGGEQRSQAEALGALRVGVFFAVLAMFGLIAVAFRSYIQPLIILAAIPFGIVGALIGHLIMGYDLSLMSFMGMVALSGVVVNGSIVLVSAINDYRRDGMNTHDALVAAGARRFRPILLTSLTTFFGLAPMILETSVQARFLIPMALSLGFGVLFVTGIALILVPALYLIVEDFRHLTHRFARLIGLKKTDP